MSSQQSSQKIWKILELITWGTDYLAQKGIDESRLTIELLLSHALQLSRIQLYTQFDRIVSESELQELRSMVLRRVAREPVQYIIGETNFMGFQLSVDKSVLIPRPETELMVYRCKQLLAAFSPQHDHLRILDIGTGSGCIAIALASFFPGCNIVAVDASDDALAVASRNAQRNGVAQNISFQNIDILKDQQWNWNNSFQCIISNPPYISTQEFNILSPEVAGHEPKQALTDGSDGLTFYPFIARIGKQYCAQEGFVAVECAFDQAQKVRTIFEKEDLVISEVHKDSAGFERFIIAHP